MPKKNMQTIIEWARINPSFAISIWVDNLIMPNYSEHLQTWAEIFSSEKLAPNQILFKEIEEGEPASAAIRYELSRLRTNYGKSSDLIRYQKIFLHGGAYFDTDVLPGTVSLTDSKIFESTHEFPCLWVDRNSQGTDQIGNDTLIATTEHPLPPPHQTKRKASHKQLMTKVHYNLANTPDSASQQAGSSSVETQSYTVLQDKDNQSQLPRIRLISSGHHRAHLPRR